MCPKGYEKFIVRIRMFTAAAENWSLRFSISQVPGRPVTSFSQLTTLSYRACSMVQVQRYDVSAWSATAYTIGRPREDEGSRQPGYALAASALTQGCPRA